MIFNILLKSRPINFCTINLTRIMSTSPPKIAKMTPYIGTHDGTFHCDDVTACYMLKQLKRFKDHEIVRTRNQEVLDKAEIVVDVGGILDVENLRLDHHQHTFHQTIKDYHPNMRTTNPNKPVRLSSAGLVFAIFGKEFIMTKLNMDKSYDELDESERKMIDTLYDKAYLEFFEEIDAIDNGVEIVNGDNIVYNYYIGSGISARVGRLNPHQKNASGEERLEQFKKAMNLVGGEISEGIDFLHKFWWPERQQFRKFVADRKEVDQSGQVVMIDSDHMLGYKTAFFELEEELGIEGELKFVIYNDGSQASPWRATSIPISPKSFICRVPLKEEWRGKRDEELQKISGIPDATFVHMSGFTGGAKSLAGVMALALLNTLGQVHAHGFLLDPIARNSVWRTDSSAPVNYNDNEMFCGGIGSIQQSGGKCGVCGDPYVMKSPRPHETGGYMTLNRTVRNYFPRSTIDILIDLDTDHGGYFTFELCRRDSFDVVETDSCFERLKLSDGSDRWLLDRNKPMSGKIVGMSLALPADLVDCKACVLRWNYHAGNNWGVCRDHQGHNVGLGCGLQELYRNCADISVGYMIRGVNIRSIIHLEKAIDGEQATQKPLENQV